MIRKVKTKIKMRFSESFSNFIDDKKPIFYNIITKNVFYYLNFFIFVINF